MQNIAIIGREKNLAYAETESVFGNITKLAKSAVIFDDSFGKNIHNLGSVIKIGLVLTAAEEQNALINSITDQIVKHYHQTSVNSIDFGVSFYGDDINEKNYKHILISIKKNLKKINVKCRFISPKRVQLNTAQVKHNNLLKNGIEILVVQDNSKFVIAKTTQLQDIDSYSLRDYGRPKRDMQVGMFPPKLAQIMLNLAGVTVNTVVYDPFCGSGVVLQEALLRGNSAWGSDLSTSMIQASSDNLLWLSQKYHISSSYKVFLGNAIEIKDLPKERFSIVTEGYLGKMLSQPPSNDILNTLQSELADLYLNFFKNLQSLTQKPASIVITLPCWQTKDGLKKLSIVDQIVNLGYTIKQFESVDSRDLIYKRPNQIVGRQILVLNVKKGS